jgi:thiol-disulfide isomerase/thioredoxin
MAIATTFMTAFIAGSFISSSHAFVSQRHVNKIFPALSHGSFDVNSRSNVYMSTAEIENPALRQFDDDEAKDDRNSVTPSKNLRPLHETGPVTAIRGTRQFLNTIENAPKDGLVVIKFHAKYCKICARVTLKFKKMAHQLSNEGTQVPITFAGIEHTENSVLCSALGVKKFPYLMMFRNMECVASFSTGPAHNFRRAVGGTIKDRLATTDTEWEKIRSDLAEEIAYGREQIRLMRLDAEAEENNNIDLSP